MNIGGRPQKEGLDYYDQEVGVYWEDERLMLLDARRFAFGVNVYDRLKHFILARGYYYELEDKNKFLEFFMIHTRLRRISIKDLLELFDMFAELDLINQSLWENNIVTSKDFQMKYLAVCKRRKLNDSYPYWILETQPKDVNEEYQKKLKYEQNSQKNKEVEVPLNTHTKKDIVNNKSINVDNKSINVNENLHSISSSISSSKSNSMSNSSFVPEYSSYSLLDNEDKIDKIDKIDKTNLQLDSNNNPFTNFLIEKRFIKTHDIDIPGYNDFFEKLCSKYEQKNITIAVKYLLKTIKANNLKIDNKYYYFTTSITNSLNKDYDNKQTSISSQENNEWEKEKEKLLMEFGIVTSSNKKENE